MAKVVLHIGTHKTASTTVQDTFFGNAKVLAEHGVIYPHLGGVRPHHGLVADWLKMQPAYQIKGGSRAALKKLVKDYADKPGTVFLSTEEFSRGDPKHRPDLTLIRKLLSPFESVEVVCMLRPQWQFLQSIYLEVSKQHVPPRPPTLIQSALTTGMAQGLFVDYGLLLDRLEDVFGAEAITFIDFEAARSGPGGILGAMLRYLDLPIGVDALTEMHGGASNVSPRPVASFVANILSEPKPAPKWLIELAGQMVKSQFGEGFRDCLFSKEEMKRIADRFEESNADVERRRAVVQPDFHLTRTDPASLTHSRADINNAIWIQMGRAVTRRIMG